MLRKLFSMIAVVVLMLSVQAMPAQADEPDPIEAAITAGLDYLVSQQNVDGSWGTFCDSIAETALVVLKLNTYTIEMGLEPLAGPYATEIQEGLDFIMANSYTQIISMEPAGDPDGNANEIGRYFTDCGGHIMYNTGIAMMALASSGDPVTYGIALQDAVDFMAWAQADLECGIHRGGWRYNPNECSSDNSNSGYVTLGLGYAQAPPPFGFGLTIPQWVKDEHTIWIDMIQDDVSGDPDDGGSWYDPYNPWVNILKTGNLLYEMGLVGDDTDIPRVQDAIDYIERHWSDPGGCDTGWQDHRQAMFTLMKGLESLGIEFLDLDDDGIAEHDWFAEVAQHLIDTQQEDGSWPSDCWGDKILSTAWALLTLEKSVPEFEIKVPVDIKPTSCRNPINTKDKGVLPVAILGTEDFDVTQVDPESVLLLGVAPLRWAYEDVATPYEPYIGKEGAFACTTEGPDGYLDLVFHFDSQELIEALGEVADGDVIVIPLTGFLKEEFGGTPIVGEDVVVILKKVKK